MKTDPKEKPSIIKTPGTDHERPIPPDFVPEPKLPTPDPQPQVDPSPGQQSPNQSIPQ